MTVDRLESTAVIVVCGEALIDLTHGADEPAGAFTAHPGGGPCNTAVGLGRLGVPTSFLGRLSTDRFGVRLREHLGAAGVDLSLVRDTDAASTLAVAHLGARGDASYAFYATHTADVDLLPADLPDLGAEVEALHFGTLSLALEPVGSTLSGLLRREHAHGRRLLALDPNVRTVMIRDLPAYRTRLEELISLSHVVKVSDADVAAVWPDQAVDDTVARLASSGPSLLTLTCGGDGVRVHHRSGTTHVPSVTVTVHDTIGAGDTFNAALLAWLHGAGCLSPAAVQALRGDQVHELVSFAARAAAITCSRPGADPPWAHELTGTTRSE